MPGYVVLGKWTQQGLASLKPWPERIKGVYAAAEKAGIRIVGVWMTVGEYDTVAVYEAPDDQTIAAFLLSVKRNGTSTGQCMRAFSEEEFAQILSKLP
jgi:uncharacterized protein with GYD domain